MIEDERPRILFEAVPDAVYEDLVDLAGTAARVEAGVPVHTSDWDLVVTFAQNAGARDASLHVLAFGAVSVGAVTETKHVVRSHTTLARRTHVAEGVNGDLAKVVARTVVATASAGSKATLVLKESTRWGVIEVSDAGDLDKTCMPLAHVGDEESVYAAIFTRHGAEPPTLSWILPEETIDHRAWLLEVLRALQMADPERFPSDPAWQDGTSWAPPPLREAHNALDAIVEERQAVLAELDTRETAARARIREEKAAAEAQSWRLLTADGPELEAAVAECLTDLGFTVRAMDEHHDSVTGARLEDLRVTTPDDPDWVCLVEVKGYTGGAKAREVSSITGRPSVNYAAEAGRPPSAVWHVVNVNRETDPSTRPVALPNETLDLAPLTAAGGALIDTRRLFIAWCAVAAGITEASAVRRSLIDARTRWTWE